MYCRQCGKKLSGNEKFCPICGTIQNTTISLPFNSPQNSSTSDLSHKSNSNYSNNAINDSLPPDDYIKNPIPKKRHTGIILGLIASIIVVIIVVFSILFFSGPSYKVYKCLEEGDYSEALSIYETEVQDSAIQKTFAKFLLNHYVEKVTDQFNNGEIDLDTANKTIDALEKIGFESAEDIHEKVISENEGNTNEDNNAAYYEGSSENDNTPVSTDSNTASKADDAENESSSVNASSSAGHTNTSDKKPSASESKNNSSSTSSGESTTNSPSSSANATSLSKAEAVALFNKASANAKNRSGKRNTSVDLVDVPGGDTLRAALTPMLPSDNESVSVTGVPNSTMQVSDFSSVTSKKSGSNWIITLNLKTETEPSIPANSRAFTELPQSEIDSALNSLALSPVDSVKFTYSGGSITAVITEDGKLVNATYIMKVNVNVQNAKVLGLVSIHSAKVTVTQTDKF